MNDTESSSVLIRGQYENANFARKIEGETAREALRNALEADVKDIQYPIMSVDHGEGITFLDADTYLRPILPGQNEVLDDPHYPSGCDVASGGWA